MSRQRHPSITPHDFRVLVAATFSDSLSRIEALEAEVKARRDRRRYIAGRLGEAAVIDRLAKLTQARQAAAEAARWRRYCELKFNPDQPRDDHGRWTSGGAGAGAKAPQPTSVQRGALTMVYETGFGPGHEAAAAGRVSSGKDDKGGVSYGAYQLSSQKGQVQAFLKSTGSQWASQFSGLDPTKRDGPFGQTWKAIAAKDPAPFLEAQARYIQATHYNPVVRQVLNATGLDINSRPLAVQQVVWSMSVQHGGAASVIKDAVNDLDQWKSPPQPGYDAALINNLYNFRGKYVIKKHVKGLPDILNRYKYEHRQALSLLREE